MRKTTLAAIAAEAGVSLPTVSKVVNGRPDVSPSTRARVEQLLDQHQYPRNGQRAARRSGLIDLVFAGLDSPWALEILRGVEEWGAQHSTAIAVSSVRHGDARPASWTSAIASHHSDGVILVTSTLTSAQVGQLRGGGIPLVVIDPANTPPPDIPSVGATNWAGGLAATEHLVSLGHRRIGAITGPADVLCSMARLDGYRSALERAGVAVDPALIRYGDFLHEGGFAGAVELLGLPERPTAIFAGSDQQAFGVYEAARQRELRIPDDLSVVGFDELPVSRWSSPPLTTVRQPLAEMGSTAAAMLGDLMDGGPLRTNRVELSTELIVRESTAPPKRPAPAGRPAPRKAVRSLIAVRPAGAGQVTETGIEAWRDPARPAGERVADLLHRMTLAEKIAQLGSVWMGAAGDGDSVAPMQDQFFRHDQPPFEELIKNGIGQLTRVFGTRPVPAAAGMSALASLQSRVAAASRLGIPAVAHEECLTGFAAWGATIFPTPLAWGASFDPALVGEMSAAFGATMHAVGIHQGLAPVIDVTRDYRWGRTEETIGEDPYLVGVLGTEYVRGLQRAGVQATLKHFAAYAASRAGRNLAPVSMGPRELADVVLVPFEMAIRLGDARSVMPTYVDINGVPASADPRLLTTVLREEYGFDGVVVSDYYAVSFLELQHAVAASPGEAAALALTAGLDVELPGTRCFGEPLLDLAAAGEVPAHVIDRAVIRVLWQKLDLGLLDPDWSPGGQPTGAPVPDLDPPAQRDIARRLAEESVILLKNDAGGDRSDNGGRVLPLAADARVAVVGPLADEPLAFFGCYSMPRHLGHQQRFDGSSGGAGVEVATLLSALRAEGVNVTGHAPGCAVATDDESGFGEAVRRCRSADLIVAVVGDEAGMFGHGTSGEGCDTVELKLPGVQEELLHALADTGLPVVAVLVTGRPYALGSVAGRLAAAVQSFFPGEEGGHAIAGVLTGRVTPSGRLPVEILRDAGAQPSTYLRSANAARHSGSSVDPTPLFAFGHGLSYTTFEYADLALSADSIATDATVEVSCTVRNSGLVAGTEVVQLYLSDPVASVVRPVKWLAGFTRAALEPGEAARITFLVHADRTSFTGQDLTRIVEPGTITVTVGGSSDDLPLTGSFTLTGPLRTVGIDRVLDTPVSVKKLTG